MALGALLVLAACGGSAGSGSSGGPDSGGVAATSGEGGDSASGGGSSFCRPLPPSDVAAITGGTLRPMVMLQGGAGVACGYQDDGKNRVTIQVHRFDDEHPYEEKTRPEVADEAEGISGPELVEDASAAGLDGWVFSYSPDSWDLYVGDEEQEVIVHVGGPRIAEAPGSVASQQLEQLAALGLEKLEP